MKENSIEEDIKNAEHFINSIKTDKEYKEGNGWHGYYNKEIVELARMLEHILSDYKRVLKINEVLLKENEEIRIKNNAIKRESEAYAEYMIRLDNELNLEKEKSKYEWIRQNCLSQELVNKLYIPVQKVKAKIEKEIKYHRKNILDIENITMLKGKTSKEEEEIEFNKYAIVVLKKMLQELLECEE